MAKIRVPKTPKSAFDPNRPPSQLLKDQLTHLEWAVRPASERKPADFRPKAARTEAQAAARIARLTARILDAASSPAADAVPARDLPPEPGAGGAVAPPARTGAAGKRRRAAQGRPARARAAGRRRR